jgi:carbon storage regulator
VPRLDAALVLLPFFQGGKRKMLVLCRKRNEAICIGADVKVHVVEVRGDKVRLGITAPASTVVDREEVYARRMALTAPEPERQPAA